MPVHIQQSGHTQEPAVTRILLLQADEADLAITNRTLEKWWSDQGYALEVALTPAEASRRVDNGKFDVIIFDLDLPDSVGLDDLRRFCRRHYELPVIALTESDNSQIALDAIASGAEDCLCKGWALGILLVRAILHACQRRRAASTLSHAAR